MHVTQICLIYWLLPSWMNNEFENNIWKWTNLLPTNNVKCMPAVWARIKKRPTKRASYTTIQKLLLQDLIARYYVNYFCWRPRGIKLWYTFSTCHDCTWSRKKTTTTCSTDTNFGWFCYKLFSKKLCWEKGPGAFLLFIIYLAKQTVLQKSNKIYSPLGSVLRASIRWLGLLFLIANVGWWVASSILFLVLWLYFQVAYR